MHPGEKIKKLRTEFRAKGGKIGLTQEELAKAIGVSRQIIVDWESGRSKVPYRRLVSLSKFFVQPLDSFQEDPSSHDVVRDTPALYGTTPPTSPVPVLGSVSDERFHFSFDQVAEEYLPVALPGPPLKRSFALRITGKSLHPTAHDGEYAIVVESSYAEDGKLAIVRLKQEFTLKRIYRSQDYIELRPDNPAYPSQKIPPDEFQVVGVVVGFFRKP